MPLNLTAEQRIEKYTRIDQNGCWLWQKYLNRDGYGMIRFEGQSWLVHRFTYQLFAGDIPPGLVIDHICRVRSCCNPAHLRVITPGENVKIGQSPNMMRHREGVCSRGHQLIDGNISFRSDGRIRCKTCVNYRARERRRRKNGK